MLSISLMLNITHATFKIFFFPNFFGTSNWSLDSVSEFNKFPEPELWHRPQYVCQNTNKSICYMLYHVRKKGITETERKTSSYDSYTFSLFFLWHRAQILIPLATSFCSVQRCVIWMKVVETTWERDGGRGWRKKRWKRGGGNWT